MTLLMTIEKTMPQYAMTFTPDASDTQDGLTHYNLDSAPVIEANKQDLKKRNLK